MAVAKAVLEEIFTEDAYQHLSSLGAQLADGLDAIFKRRGLPWTAFRCGPRSGFCLEPSLPRTGDESANSLDAELIDARRVFMANRGIWDAVLSAGPQVSIAHTSSDVETYLQVVDEFLGCIAV